MNTREPLLICFLVEVHSLTWQDDVCATLVKVKSSTTTFFPLGQMVAGYTSWPLLIQSTLLSLPLDQLEEIPQQSPQELEQAIPWGKEEKLIWEERVKSSWEVLFECTSVRLASTPRLSLQPTKCIYLQTCNEYENLYLDYVEHPQLKTWAQLSSIKRKKTQNLT